MRRITVSLFEEERDALHALARRERRDLRKQAAILIVQGLLRQGFLELERDKSNNVHRSGQNQGVLND